MKRILSWALTVMMLIGCFSSFAAGTASAATVDTSNPISITQWQDPTGTIKAGFGVLVPSNTSTATVEFVWQGGYYTATVGTEAFTSVDDARMAGKTQLIMPALNYSKVDITGSIELYGNHYGISPNAIPEDRTKDWTKSTDWKNDVTRVTGNINISKAAAPTSSRGTNIVIDGIRLDGFFMDNVRPVSKYATNIRMSNIMFSFSKSTTGTHHVIDLETELARLETDDVINNDSFIVENSRFDFVTSSSSTRVFDEDSPRTVIVNNNYFAEGFPRLGWFKQRTNVKEGYLEVSNNYFKKGGSIIHFCADINYSEASNSDIKSVAKFNNNVVYEVIEGALVITPSAFVSTEVSGNVFIDTKNLHKHPISAYIYKDAMKGVNYADVLTVKGNRFIGVSDHLMLNDGTTKLADDNANYYAMYTEDFANGQGDGRMYGALEGNDYYLDFNASVLASDAVMQADREGMSVYAKGNTASIIIAKDETYVPALKTVKGVPFALFTDKNYASVVSAVTADDVKGGRVYYAKAVTETNVVIEYKVVISAGDKNAPAYEDGYLLYDKTADMPVGAKFVATYKGNEYTFTSGFDAFPSLAQITVAHKKDERINVILLEDVYEGGYHITGDFKILGDNTVIKTPFEEGPVRIACVGDSITEAVIDGGRATWGYPARLNDFLNEQFGDGMYEVKNFGKGNSSLQQINTTTNTALPNANRSQYNQGSWYYSALNYNPDVVMVMIGHNDTQVSETDHIYKSAANYKKYYVDLIESFKALPSHPQVIVVSCHSRSDSFRKNLVEKCIIPVQKELAERYNTIFVDTYTMTDNMKNAADGVYSSDNLHLTPKGYALLAGLIKDGTDGIYSSKRNVRLDGLRFDKNAEPETAPAKIKVAAMGDDTTYGSKSYVNYPTALGEILGDGYEVRNYGECAATTKTYYAGTEYGEMSDYHSALEWAPDIAILGFGINNASNVSFTNSYQKMVDELKAKGTKIYILTSLKKSVNETLTEFATTNNIELIDTYTYAKDNISASKKQTSYLFTEEGNVEYATFIAKEIFDVTATPEENVVLSGDQFHDVTTDYIPVTEAPAFTDRADSTEKVKSDAVAVIDEVSKLAAGGKVIARWDGKYYEFTAGANAFATLEEALATNAKQIIVPAGILPKFEVTRSVEIYGANYNVMPWVLSGDKVVQNPDWGKYGESVVYKTDIVITKEAVGANIVVSGFRMTRGFNDTARPLSEQKTSVTLENNILDRCFETGEFREFNLTNANNKNATDNTVTNNDEFTIKNMMFQNRGANTGHALFQEQLPSYFTIDGFGCNIDMATFGFPKWGLGTKVGKMTLKNSFIKDNSDASSRFLYVANFSGHSSGAAITDEEIAKCNLSLEISNNNFIDCYDGGTDGAVVIYPASFTNIVVDGNTFVSSADLNVRAVQWLGTATFRPNVNDYSENIKFTNNRIIGSIPSHYVNDKTKLDLSGNYFETYTLSFRNGVTGDIPADIDADYCLDYNLTTRISDMAPAAAADIEKITTDSATRTIYGYATEGNKTLALTSDKGVEYSYYSDAQCKNRIESIDVTVGNATTAYVKAKRGNVQLVYAMYVMGVKDLADVTSADMNKSLEGISDATLYYPSLYAAPNGIEVISYYDGTPVKFTTGKNVASSTGEMVLYGDDIIFPDDITEIESLELVTAVNVYSAVADIKGIKMRKVKIACVGDSITDGVINGGRQDSYPTTMQSLLGKNSFDIQNFGGSGATAQYIERLRLNASAGDRERHYKVLRKSMYTQSISYNGDVVIIGLGANDSAVNEPVRWLSNYNFINQYIDLIREYQALPSKPAIYLTTTTPRYDQPKATVLIQENMRYIEQVIADITGAKVIDLNSLMDYMFASTATTYSTDMLHPTATGYHEMGQIIADEVTKTLAPIEQNTVSVNGGTISGTIESSVKNTKLALNDNTVVIDTPVIDGTNIDAIALNNAVVMKGNAVVSEFNTGEFVKDGGDVKVDLGVADIDKIYDSLPNITVTNDNAVALLKAIQAQNAGATDFACAGIEALLTVDADTLTVEQAKNAVEAIRTGGHVMIDVKELGATCTQDGHNAHKACVHCDYLEGYELIKSEGHKWGEWVYNNDATEKADGTETRTCTVCKTETETRTKEGSKLPPSVVIQDTSKIFTDVKAGKWYTKAVDYCYSYGFIAGTSATEFGRDTNVTRGMFITILARIAGVDTGKTANKVATKFTDVKSGKYYTAAIKWANDNGIVSGTSETTFGPENAISRQDLCVMIVNYAKFMNIALAEKEAEIAFSDASKISKYATNAVKVCQMADIVNGYAEGKGFEFRPKNTATRAEAAQILYVFHKTFMA